MMFQSNHELSYTASVHINKQLHSFYSFTLNTQTRLCDEFVNNFKIRRKIWIFELKPSTNFSNFTIFSQEVKLYGKSTRSDQISDTIMSLLFFIYYIYSFTRFKWTLFTFNRYNHSTYEKILDFSSCILDYIYSRLIDSDCMKISQIIFLFFLVSVSRYWYRNFR